MSVCLVTGQRHAPGLTIRVTGRSPQYSPGHNLPKSNQGR